MNTTRELVVISLGIEKSNLRQVSGLATRGGYTKIDEFEEIALLVVRDVIEIHAACTCVRLV
jgi:hypothetical protein